MEAISAHTQAIQVLVPALPPTFLNPHC